MNDSELSPNADFIEATAQEANVEASELLSLKRAAEALGVSAPTARRLVSLGKLPAAKVMVGDRLCWKVKPESLKSYLEAELEARKALPGPEPRQKPAERMASSAASQFANSVPLETHQSALDTARLALERLQYLESQVEQQRSRADLVERQKYALEMELRQYQAALAEQSESLAEARAKKQAAEIRLEQLATPELPLKLETHRPTFGQRVKGWFGLKNAQ